MIKYFLLFLLVCCLFSCKSTKNVVVPKKVLPNITEGKLLKNIYSKELEYNSLYAKKLDISISKGNKTDNVKASLKIKRDSFIWISVTAPLGIEIARVLLTPDSVKFIDTFHKKYFVSDYRYFSDKFDISLNYNCFQNILTNTFFNLENCSGKADWKEDKYKFEKNGENYVLSNVQERAISRKIKKYLKKKRKNKDYALVLQQIQIDPETFRPVKLSLEDMEDDFGVSAKYSDFNNFNGKIFPEILLFTLNFEENNIKLELRFSKLEFDVDVVPNFKISSKYKAIK